ncbi:hypothetical protein [Streptomyces sp. NPDC001404]|uniref:DUF7691 family protein n=1 Tax=Streptomyces sp. NPDC001404 TaxID=3364571 RepID=UPI0036C42EA1
MIIWINGPFGGGKTTTTGLLHQALDGSLVYDPKEVGSMLRSILPGREKDFQDLAPWRPLVAATAIELHAYNDRRPLTVRSSVRIRSPSAALVAAVGSGSMNIMSRISSYSTADKADGVAFLGAAGNLTSDEQRNFDAMRELAQASQRDLDRQGIDWGLSIPEALPGRPTRSPSTSRGWPAHRRVAVGQGQACRGRLPRGPGQDGRRVHYDTQLLFEKLEFGHDEWEYATKNLDWYTQDTVFFSIRG